MDDFEEDIKPAKEELLQMEEIEVKPIKEELLQMEDIEISLLNKSPSINSNIKIENEITISVSKISDSGYEDTVPDTFCNSITSESIQIPQQNKMPGDPLAVRSNNTPVDFYKLFVTDSILQQIVNATNKFAVAETMKIPEANRKARIRNWKPTKLKEIKKFFSLIIFMGIVKLPKLADYWSTDEITNQPFPRTVMSRNRFELLLQMLYFSEKIIDHNADRLHLVRKLVNAVNANFKRQNLSRTKIAVDDGKTKAGVDFADRLDFCALPLRKSLKWYKKLAINLLLNTAVVNALTLYQQVTNNRMQMVDFRKEILKSFCQKDGSARLQIHNRKNVSHKIGKKLGNVRDTRRTCQQCYKDNVKLFGRMVAKNKTKKVSTFCEDCPEKPHLCISCFNKIQH